MEKAEMAIRRSEGGVGTMSSWVVIVFGYVVIAVGLYNLLGANSHLLF